MHIPLISPICKWLFYGSEKTTKQGQVSLVHGKTVSPSSSTTGVGVQALHPAVLRRPTIDTSIGPVLIGREPFVDPKLEAGIHSSGKEIFGFDKITNDCIVFHAGTRKSDDGKIVSNGGRVLNIVGKAASLKKAIEIAYKNSEIINFDNKYYRTDIGQKGL